MRLTNIILGIALCSSGLACDTPEPDAEAFRGWTPSPDFWNWGPQYAGNLGLTVHDDVAQGELGDCILWDLAGGGTVDGPPSQGSPTIMAVVDNDIFDPAGELQCYAAQEAPYVFKLRTAQGDHLLTAWGRYVFDIDVSQMPAPGTSAYADLVDNHLILEYYYDSIYQGMRWRDQLLGTADAQIKSANPMRKLVLGALFHGVCGSAGLPTP